MMSSPCLLHSLLQGRSAAYMIGFLGLARSTVNDKGGVMGLFGFSTATKGGDRSTRAGILLNHLQTFLRRATPRKLANFALAETERLLKRERVRSRPYLLKIEPSNICNMRCPYCYDGRPAPQPGERGYGRMSLDQFDTLLDEVGPYLFRINLYGFGEPFLFPETMGMIRSAHRHNIGVAVSSNLQLDKPGLAEEIVASGLETLIVSIHGATKETCATFMGGGNMDLALDNIRAVLAARCKAGSRLPQVHWQYCVTGFNAAEMDQARALAVELGVDRIRFIRPLLPPGAGPEWDWEKFPRGDARKERQGCAWLYRAAYINWDGGILPCCKDSRDKALDFGNVLDAGLGAVWNNPSFRSARLAVAGKSPGASGLPETICDKCPVVLDACGKDR